MQKKILSISETLSSYGLTHPQITDILIRVGYHGANALNIAQMEINYENYRKKVEEHKRKLKEKKPFYLLPFTIEFKWRNK